jgi:hypothetical protein
MRRVVLTFVMMLEGVLLILGAVGAVLPTAVLPIDQYLGSQASAAAAALGIGLCVAAANPPAHVAWVRIGILYAALSVGYQTFTYFVLGKPIALLAVTVAVVCGVLMAVLYPHRGDLMPKTPRQLRAASVAPGPGSELYAPLEGG